MDIKNIPAYLKMEGYWCKYELMDGKYKPINPNTNEPAKINNSNTFGSFGEVSRILGSEILVNNKIGYGLGLFSGLCAIDINDCVHNGSIDDAASELITDCNSYAEYSPSGTGVRVIFRAEGLTIDKKTFNIKNRALKAEFIGDKINNKFLAMTGNTINNLDVNDIDINLIFNKYFLKKDIAPTEIEYSIVSFNINDLNDTAYARLFNEKFGKDLLYNVESKCWMIWNGKYWQYDDTNQVKVMVEFIAEDIRSNLKRVSEANEIKAINQAVKYLLSHSGKENVLSEAQHLKPIHEADFDNDDYLLNTASGVLNLQTGEILKWDKKYLMTKYIDIELKNGYPEKYMTFLNQIYQGNDELIDYVNRLFAYCLTGSTKEQEMYFFAGDGANGKSVLFDLMERIWGDYASTASADLLIDKNMQNNCKSELATLKGVRMVFASELDANSKLKMSMVKNITGGTKIVAKFLYKNEFTYRPKYKVLLATNHMPRITEDDNGSMRRIKKIDHLRVFKKEEQDKYLIEKLYTERGEILNYLFMQCPEVISKGLATPSCVEMSVGNFFKSEDVFERWLDECTEPSNEGEFSSRLFEAYREWLQDNNEMWHYKNTTTNGFGRKLGKKFTKTEIQRKKYYIGVKLK